MWSSCLDKNIGGLLYCAVHVQQAESFVCVCCVYATPEQQNCFVSQEEVRLSCVSFEAVWHFFLPSIGRSRTKFNSAAQWDRLGDEGEGRRVSLFGCCESGDCDMLVCLERRHGN